MIMSYKYELMRRLQSLYFNKCCYICSDCLHDIVRDEGVLALWTGLLPSLMVLVSNPAIQFIVLWKPEKTSAILDWAGGKYGIIIRLYYYYACTHLCGRQLLLHLQELSGLLLLCCWAVAKLFATVATYPFQIMQTRLRVGVKLFCHMWKQNLKNKCGTNSIGMKPCRCVAMCLALNHV